MTTTAKSGAARKGGAARRERAGTKPTVAFHDLKLKLPKELPPELLFDITEFEASSQNPLPVFRLLRSLLGGEQFSQVRNLVADNTAKLDEIGELINECFEQYGVTPGESAASPSS